MLCLWISHLRVGEIIERYITVLSVVVLAAPVVSTINVPRNNPAHYFAICFVTLVIGVVVVLLLLSSTSLSLFLLDSLLFSMKGFRSQIIELMTYYNE